MQQVARTPPRECVGRAALDQCSQKGAGPWDDLVADGKEVTPGVRIRRNWNLHGRGSPCPEGVLATCCTPARSLQQASGQS